jgi:pimeloyl-ACP methyl ester carboxylesterase
MFMREAVRVPAPFVLMMRLMPAWPKIKAVAHTLPYDAAVLGDVVGGKPLPRSRWAGATMPVLVIDGGKSPLWIRNGARALADVLSDAQHRTLPGQTHMVKPQALAPALIEFFTQPAASRDREHTHASA